MRLLATPIFTVKIAYSSKIYHSITNIMPFPCLKGPAHKIIPLQFHFQVEIKDLFSYSLREII